MRTKTKKDIDKQCTSTKPTKYLCVILLFVISCNNRSQVEISAPERDVFDEFTTIRKRIHVDDFGGAKSFLS